MSLRADHDIEWLQRFTVDVCRNALGKRKGHRLWGIRRILGPHAHDRINDVDRRIQFFEVFGLMGQSGQIGIR